MISFLRVARVARVFKLVKSMKGLNKLVTTLIKSIPSLINIAILLMLLFFVFACMGMNLFSEIGMGMGDVPEGWGNVPGLDNLNQHANFRSFESSLLVLFRMSTGVRNPVQHALLTHFSHSMFRLGS
jgi:voltage-dependent calcium channel T type alpha-1G